MKNSISRKVLLLLSILTMAVSCKKPDIEEKVLKLYAPSSFIFEESGGNETIYIHSSDVWNVTSDQSWCLVSPASGPAGDASFTIKVDGNNSTDLRHANVKITSGSLSESITVTQKKDHKVSELKLLTPSSITFDEKGSYQTIYFRSSEEWNMVSDQQWCNVSPASGSAGEASVTVIVKDNDTYDQRNARLTIRTSTMSESLTVTQKQMDAMLISSNKVELSSEANHVDITVKSNVTFEYEILGSAKEWISVSATRALTEQTIGFNVMKNESESNRQGTILFKGTSGQVELVEVYQDGGVSAPDPDPIPDPEIVLTQKKYTVVSEGEELKIEIKSNVDYEFILPSVDWLSEVETRSLSTYTHYVKVAPNMTSSSRSAYIMVRSLSGSKVELIEVLQYGIGTSDIKLYATSLVMDANRGSATISFYSSKDWNVESDQNWCRVSPSSGSPGDHTVRVELDPNEGYDERNARLLISTSSMSSSVTVTQKQKNAMLISSNKVEMSSEGSDFSINLRSNVSFEYEVLGSASEWLRPINTRGLNEHDIRFQVMPNTSTEKRQGSILFKGSGDIYEIVDVYQDGKTMAPEPEEELVLTYNKYIVDSAGDELKIEIRSNVDYEFILPSVDWLSEVETRSLSTYTHYVKVAPNMTSSSRSAYIMVRSLSGSKVEIIEVNQSGKSLPEKTVKITHENNTFTTPEFWGVEVLGRIDWGDGFSIDYKPDLMHIYSSEEEHVVKMEMTGADGFKIKNLKGIKHIDLSNFK